MNTDAFFQNLRTWAELAYFISGIVLALAALYGLQQIRIMKKDMLLRNERAAKEKAIEYASRYLSTYVHFDSDFLAESRAKGVGVSYTGPVGDFSPNSIDRKYGEVALARFKLKSVLPLLNELQSIAAAYATGVADEETGFNIIGRTYCATVTYHYDIICFSRGDSTCEHYQSIVNLYETWASRLSKAELQNVRDRIGEQMALIPEKRLPTIGVDRDKQA